MLVLEKLGFEVLELSVDPVKIAEAVVVEEPVEEEDDDGQVDGL